MSMRYTIPLMIILGITPAMLWAQPSEPDPAGSDPLPSLDELLGLEEQGQGSDDPNDKALQDILSPREAGEALGQAITLMDRVAQRIGDESDVSLPTQRLQEDILRKLDQVIESAQNNQQGGGGSSSSAQSSSSSSQQQPDQQQQGEQNSSQSGDASNPDQANMPGGTSVASPGDALAPNGVSWGALPQRIRDALSQGISDRYSEMYRSLTEDFYKSLAEEEEP